MKKPKNSSAKTRHLTMNRYFLPADAWEDSTLVLTENEATHCARVMRACEGDKIEIFDGVGKSAICTIESISRNEVKCRASSQKIQPAASHPITLCQAIPKGGNMELIVQKAVELGVSTIQPLITKHTIARPGSLEKKQAKWQRIALEACKQCGQNHLPYVLTPVEFSPWISQVFHTENYGTAIIASLAPQALPLKSFLKSSPPQGNIAFLVGPEGDFSLEEYQAAADAHFSPISLGNIILRVETATLYGLSVLHYNAS